MFTFPEAFVKDFTELFPDDEPMRRAISEGEPERVLIFLSDRSQHPSAKEIGCLNLSVIERWSKQVPRCRHLLSTLKEEMELQGRGLHTDDAPH